MPRSSHEFGNCGARSGRPREPRMSQIVKVEVQARPTSRRALDQALECTCGRSEPPCPPTIKRASASGSTNFSRCVDRQGTTFEGTAMVRRPASLFGAFSTMTPVLLEMRMTKVANNHPRAKGHVVKSTPLRLTTWSSVERPILTKRTIMIRSMAAQRSRTISYMTSLRLWVPRSPPRQWLATLRGVREPLTQRSPRAAYRTFEPTGPTF